MKAWTSIVASTAAWTLIAALAACTSTVETVHTTAGADASSAAMNGDDAGAGTNPGDAAAAAQTRPSPCSVMGTVNGDALRIVDCTATTEISAGLLSSHVILSEADGVCAAYTANRVQKGTHVLDIHFVVQGSALAAGKYPAGGDNGVDIVVRRYTSTCGSGAALANGGSITVTRADSRGVAGVFDITLDSEDHITGSFDTTRCSATEPNGDPTCM